MPFSASELARIKVELGFNLMPSSSELYIDYSRVFVEEVNAHIEAEIVTTSATTVSTATQPTPVALTLADATGFAAADVVVVDVDARRERATIAAIVGSAITVQLTRAHSGTYPVSVLGPIPLARECLERIDAVKERMASTFGNGALKQVDEVQFYGDGKRSQFAQMWAELMAWRNELASILGVQNLWATACGPARVSVY